MPKLLQNKNNQSEVEMNAYAQRLAELQQQPDHVLKQIGDQWQTPQELAMGLFWHFTPKIGPIVLDLFADECNALCAEFYTSSDNALTQEWANDLRQLGGAAFANPPYSRPESDSDGTPITGIENILAYCREQRELGAKIMLLIKAGTSEGWWPEDADFIQFISGRIGFKTPNWYVPRDPKKDKPSSSGFASAVVIFDKDWKWERRPTERLSRHLLEAQGQLFINMIESRAAVIAQEKISQFVPGVIEETTAEPVAGEQIEPSGLAPVQCEDVAEADSVEEPDADVPDDNYHLYFKDEDPEEDYSDKTIEQIYSAHEENIQCIVMLTILFGKKSQYSHREIQFAMTSLLTDGGTTNTKVQYENMVAVDMALKEFLRKNTADLNRQHDLIYALITHDRYPANRPVFKNVKYLVQVSNASQEEQGIDAAIAKIKAESEAFSDSTPTMTIEWLRAQYMKDDDFAELFDGLKSEALEKTIDVAKEIDDHFKDVQGAKKVIDVIDAFFASKPTYQVYLNVRQLRAAFRSLIQASIKEAAPCPEA